ncbi:mandelate racemase/muconate lactonizing enzyme family protein [Thalassobaculum sp. OXR-137]|uniref:mandelate racemase/muconate lactonizing enzyme family protein n=1 Tax=Thalassobaculum sp. OXR-137 TaxID=3100173 RepID=UPI002AC8E568|nr:mandelate racemase/muconate lactonizing enzyme family protein [Thalassobaculum sp. OXR-137]WPZ35104.1 mandelate racemase/muconate lactonizing enzyme family protein [Thalassobaculum sp. OXR-137]
MKVTGIETIRLDEFPNLLWVHVETDEGLKGLGETFYGAQSAEAHVHAIIAPYLLGQDPLQIERHHANLIGYVGFTGAGAEQRGRSAVDIALWDLWGKASGQPIHQLLGGASRDDIRVYNTCAGYQYVRQKPVQGTQNFGLGGAEGPYEDLDAFLNNADELAQSLLEMGIDAMKIWPFDYAAEASQGQYISASDLKKGLEPFEKIRAAVGDRMDIMCELHSMWNRPSAVKIARALEEIGPLWVEDPVFMDHLGSLGEVARSTTSPIAVGETRGGKADFRYLVELDALSVIIADLTWCGGLTEGRKISTLCDAWHVPVAFHDCTGPVALTASTHLALHTRNCFIQEMVRAFYYGWYGELVTQLPPVEKGRIRAPDGPGLGLELIPDIAKRPDAQVRRSTL